MHARSCSRRASIFISVRKLGDDRGDDRASLYDLKDTYKHRPRGAREKVISQIGDNLGTIFEIAGQILECCQNLHS